MSSLKFSTRKYHVLQSCSQPLQYILFFIIILLLTLYGNFRLKLLWTTCIGRRERCCVQMWHLLGCLCRSSRFHVEMRYLRHSPYQNQVASCSMGKDRKVGVITNLRLLAHDMRLSRNGASSGTTTGFDMDLN